MTTYRHVLKCRLSQGGAIPFFYLCLKSCALRSKPSDGPCGAADDSVRIVGNWKRKELEFQKEYLKLVNEEPTPVMPNEMEKLVSELSRDRPVFFATIAVTLTAAALPTSATSSFAGNWSEGLPQK
ncbi:MAG: hypothetical protein E6J74_40005 [Deltaproteobacteria bacterium]|nr:MAG: hypothetical protein E6J74_40005 [Deltaproteobacteria bacterium]